MASPKNAKITNLADVVVNSLTKYAGWEGDVMMGSLAFPSPQPSANLFLNQPGHGSVHHINGTLSAWPTDPLLQ